MTVRYSPEHLADDITTYLRANIEAALARVRVERSDPRITTPAVYTIFPEIDFKKKEKNANYISAESPFMCSVVVEDVNTEVLTRRVWRYVAALAEALDNLHLTGQTGAYKLVVVVNKARFSKLYTNAQAKGETSGVFRLEGVLECAVSHFENL
jgi:hypothetical protein